MELKNNRLDLNFMSILKTTIVSFLVYNIASIFPLISFVFPVYKIKTNRTMNSKEIFITNITTLLLISILSRFSMMLYVSVFLVIEAFYYGFEISKIKVKIYDRIILTSLVSTGFILFFLGYAGEAIELLKKTVSDIYVNQYGFSQRDLSIILRYLSEYKIFLVFMYSGVVVYLTYLSLMRNTYKDWKISYEWIIIYIIAFFTQRYSPYGKILAMNVIEILKISYTLYGIKLIYTLINSKLKINILSQAISFILGFYFSGITFILGALECFDFLKIHIIKINNGGKK
ncbi:MULTISPECIES: hypothetical protein [Fusobacterium]|uniref:hypothetical protein n=1 Tax=Fusobacterium TaxID=848 RepID=UPI001476EDDD|nr:MULTISPECIES: hypothetical protein [Fusobacterium]NME35018.1 hypothetical protein [Fusobacterium sp. FSA-380-WT-3A]